MTSKNDEQLTYEMAYDKLELLVGELESGDLTLERSLEIFEESIRMVVYCQKKLDEAERKIEMLVSKAGEDNNDKDVLQDFTD